MYNLESTQDLYNKDRKPRDNKKQMAQHYR